MIRDELVNHYKYKKHSGSYGIELETEVADAGFYPPKFLTPIDHERFAIDMKYWKAKKDGSLRNFGIEYILDQPQPFDKALLALEEFDTKTSGIPFLQHAPHTSTHVHIDFSNQKFTTLLNFICLWILFENIMMEYSGMTRRSNLFSLPTALAEGNVTYIINMLKAIDTGSSPFSFNEGLMKYAAMNLHPLKTQGSVEIRCYRGTTDVILLKRWLSILNKMYVYAQSGIYPIDIMRRYQKKGPGLLHEVFGDLSLILTVNTPHLYESIQKNVWYLKEIIMSVPDWSVIDTIYSTVHDKKRQEKIKTSAATSTDLTDAYVHAMQFLSTPNSLNQINQTSPNPQVSGIWVDESATLHDTEIEEGLYIPTDESDYEDYDGGDE